MSFVIEGPNSSADIRNESDKILREMYLNNAILKDRNQFLDWMKLQSMRIIYPDKIEQPKKASIDTMKPVQSKYDFSKSEEHANFTEIDINNEELRTPNISNLEKLSKIRIMFQRANVSDSSLTPNMIALSKPIKPLPSVNECNSNYTDISLKSPKSSHSSSYDKENIPYHHPAPSKSKIGNILLTHNDNKNEASSMISPKKFSKPEQTLIQEKSQNQTTSKEGITASNTNILSNNNSVTFSSSLDQNSPSTQLSSDCHPSSDSLFIDPALMTLTATVNDNQSTVPAVEHTSHTTSHTSTPNVDISDISVTNSAKTASVVLDSAADNNNTSTNTTANSNIAPQKVPVFKPTPTIPPLPLSFNVLQKSTASPPATAPARTNTATVTTLPEKSVSTSAATTTTPAKLEVPSLSSKTKEYLDSLLVEKDSYNTTNKSPAIVYSSDYVRHHTPSKEDSLVQEDLMATLLLSSPRATVNVTSSPYNHSRKSLSLTSGAVGSGLSKDNKSESHIRVNSGSNSNTESVAWYLQSPRELDTPRKLALEADLSSLRTRDFAQFIRPPAITVHYRSPSPSKSNDNLNILSRSIPASEQEQGHTINSNEVDLSNLSLEKIKILTGHY